MLHVVTSRPWMAQRLGATTHSDSEVLDTSSFVDGRDAAWLSGSNASMHWAEADDDWGFQDARWWELSIDLLGRRVRHASADEVADLLRGGDGFVKLARHKYAYFPAEIRSAGRFAQDLTARRWLPGHEFVWSEIVDIDVEYRVWVADGAVLYGCHYAVDGVQRSVDGLPVPPGVLTVARDVAATVAGAYVVDVAVLRSGATVVVETNPVWCAGILDAPTEVLETALLAAQGRENVIDRFAPDAAVQEMLARGGAARNAN